MARMVRAIPKLASLDIERSLAFFEKLGFSRKISSDAYGVAERDGVSLHFWRCTDPRTPAETGCRIAVEGIEALFNDYGGLGVIHPKGGLENKPWGLKEFSVVDVDGNLVTFQEAVG